MKKILGMLRMHSVYNRLELRNFENNVHSIGFRCISHRLFFINIQYREYVLIFNGFIVLSEL